jgi:hypothetical protein
VPPTTAVFVTVVVSLLLLLLACIPGALVLGIGGPLARSHIVRAICISAALADVVGIQVAAVHAAPVRLLLQLEYPGVLGAGSSGWIVGCV